MFEVLGTAKEVADAGRHVRIDHGALKDFSTDLIRGGIQVPPLDRDHHFFDGGERTVSYFFVLDSINFCFWPEHGKERWEIDVPGGRISGYYALALRLKEAFTKGMPIADARFLAHLPLEGLKEILGGHGELQLMEQRCRILNELGKVLLRNYEGQAFRIVEAAKESALGLTRRLARDLSSFRDVAEYEGRSVFFYKRAQILTADLHGAFQGEGWGRFEDMEELTAFADYKVPQVLRHLGILRYADALSRRIDHQVLIPPGSLPEVEIRANTIWAVELIRRELKRSGMRLHAWEIDWVLWNRGQKEEYRAIPYHRTATIFY